MASIQKTAGGYRVQLHVLGKRDSGTFATKREAHEWSARRDTEIRAEGAGEACTTKTLLDALLRYALEVSREKRGWRAETVRLQAFAKQTLPVRKKIAALTTADIAQWRDDRLKVNARGSVLRDLTLLGSVMETARREWGWIKANPVRDVRKPAEPDHRERIIHRREIRAMLVQLGCRPRQPTRTVSQAVGRAFLLALRTGMRAGELCALRWADVHADHCTLLMTKSGKPRNVPLTRKARSLLARMRSWDNV